MSFFVQCASWFLFDHGDLLLVATLWAQKSERFVWPTTTKKKICFESHYFYARLFRQDDTFWTKKTVRTLYQNTLYGPRPLSATGALLNSMGCVASYCTMVVLMNFLTGYHICRKNSSNESRKTTSM